MNDRNPRFGEMGSGKSLLRLAKALDAADVDIYHLAKEIPRTVYEDLIEVRRLALAIHGDADTYDKDWLDIEREELDELGVAIDDGDYAGAYQEALQTAGVLLFHAEMLKLRGIADENA